MDFSPLADEQFVSLVTFRKTGVGVPTTVWFAFDGDDLLVTTPAGSGKVKRIRNNPAVTLQACGRLGKLKEGSPVLLGSAAIEADNDRANDILSAKYKLEYRIAMGIEKRSKKSEGRLILRITPQAS